MRFLSNKLSLTTVLNLQAGERSGHRRKPKERTLTGCSSGSFSSKKSNVWSEWVSERQQV